MGRHAFTLAVSDEALPGRRLGDYRAVVTDFGGRMERVMGIEPTLVAWEATVLPLNYTRIAVRILCSGPPDRP